MNRATEDFTKFKLNEVHPGAAKMEETISRYKKLALSRGISLSSIATAMQLMVDLYSGELDSSELPKFDSRSDQFKALQLMDECVHTLLDDGYPDDWIYNEFSVQLSD